MRVGGAWGMGVVLSVLFESVLCAIAGVQADICVCAILRGCEGVQGDTLQPLASLPLHPTPSYENICSPIRAFLREHTLRFAHLSRYF